MADSKYQLVQNDDPLDSSVERINQSGYKSHHHHNNNNHTQPHDSDASGSSFNQNDGHDKYGNVLTDEHYDDDGEEEDLSQSDSAPMMPLKNYKQKSSQRHSPLKMRGKLLLLKNFIVRHRLSLVALAGLIFILMPLIVYQRAIRKFFWMDHVYVSVIHLDSLTTVGTERERWLMKSKGIPPLVSYTQRGYIGDMGT